jgi:hypothetical protein
MRCPIPLPLQYRRLLARVADARRVRRAAAGQADLSPARLASINADALSFFANLPLRPRLENLFTDAMLAMEEALGMCELERDKSRDTTWIEPQIRIIYEQVNSLMKALSD